MIMSLLAFAAVLLIAYWWANTGAFSALVHMMCVITAGAVAFAIWEPVSYRLLESPVEGHAKGLVLIGTFVGLTALLRLLTDKFIPMNLNFPRAADVAVGGAFGLASGILSVGIMIISMGYFQSTVTIGDYTGWSRRSDVPTAPTIGSDNAPMLHIASATASFYGYLSWGSFTPWLGGGTFATHSPDLFRQSASINRDSFGEGQGRIAIQPGAVSDLALFDVPTATLSGAVGSAPAAAWAVSFTVAQDGYEALRQLEAHPDRFDCVLMDCQMPHLDGYTTTERIRSDARWKHLPVIAMTASALVSDRERALAVGMNDHVPKPLDVNQMYQVITRWIQVAHRARIPK